MSAAAAAGRKECLQTDSWGRLVAHCQRTTGAPSCGGSRGGTCSGKGRESLLWLELQACTSVKWSKELSHSRHCKGLTGWKGPALMGAQPCGSPRPASRGSSLLRDVGPTCPQSGSALPGCDPAVSVPLPRGLQLAPKATCSPAQAPEPALRGSGQALQQLLHLLASRLGLPMFAARRCPCWATTAPVAPPFPSVSVQAGVG